MTRHGEPHARDQFKHRVDQDAPPIRGVDLVEVAARRIVAGAIVLPCSDLARKREIAVALGATYHGRSTGTVSRFSKRHNEGMNRQTTSTRRRMLHEVDTEARAGIAAGSQNRLGSSISSAVSRPRCASHPPVGRLWSSRTASRPFPILATTRADTAPNSRTSWIASRHRTVPNSSEASMNVGDTGVRGVAADLTAASGVLGRRVPPKVCRARPSASPLRAPFAAPRPAR
jgi:hypothetical protein